ncbi:MAG: DNA-directed RNA polymerase subunit L [Candidatus Woesearchaeota archaeon]
MEINVLENDKKRLVFEVSGEDATLCNSLRKELWNDDDVKAAAYTTQNPNATAPKMIVETNGKDPKKALLEAADRLKKEGEKAKKAFAKAAK